jgi:predicted O-methyltransferase YrrM
MDLFREFSPSAEMQFIRADSHAADTQEEVAAAVDGGVDLLFIDGDHTYEGVKQDFEMYRQFVADGGLIALHDIVPHPKSKAVVGDRRYTVVDIEERHLSWSSGHPDCNVNQFWTELADEYETEMIISHPQQTWAGIGVVYM